MSPQGASSPSCSRCYWLILPLAAGRVAGDPFRAGEEEVGPCPVRTRNCRTTPDGCLVEAPKTQSSLVWSSTPRCSFLLLLVGAVGAELVEPEAVGLADSVWCWPRPHSCSPPLALSGSLQRRYLARFYPEIHNNKNSGEIKTNSVTVAEKWLKNMTVTKKFEINRTSTSSSVIVAPFAAAYL